MDLAVLGRDIENAHLLAPAASIGIHAHDDARTGLQRLAAQAIDERLRNRKPLAFHQCRLAVRTRGRDGEIHVRVHPVELLDCPFDHHLLRRIEHGLAVMGRSNGASQRGCDEGEKCGSRMFHV
jgi:hypothetical protein